ncbi:MAG: HemK family protein methyltransferase [bacterium]|nr:HemK family protein methyltransferase [bacterium]
MQRSRISQEIQWLLGEKHHGLLTPFAKKDIAKLQKGEHVDYVIGFVDFLGCKIDLSLKPLIPRPETEYWVERAIQEMRGKGSRLQTKNYKLKTLDMFAGSGCIGVAILKHIPWAVVDFAEKDKRLLSQLRLNAKKNGIEKKRYRVLHSDMFSGIKGKYDYIFANPPYIAESRKSKVQTSVLKHEPREALFAGKDGLRVIRPFLSQAKDFLVEGGSIYLEFDSPQKKEIEKLLRRFQYQHWQFCRDQYEKWRLVVIQENPKNGGVLPAPFS